MYFISEKDGQNVQIELASAFPSPNTLCFSQPPSCSLVCVMLTVHMFDFYSRGQIHTYLYVKYGNVCRRDDGHRDDDDNHTMPIDWYLLYNISIILLVSAGSVPRMRLAEISVSILSIPHAEPNDGIENDMRKNHSRTILIQINRFEYFGRLKYSLNGYFVLEILRKKGGYNRTLDANLREKEPFCT